MTALYFRHGFVLAVIAAEFVGGRSVAFISRQVNTSPFTQDLVHVQCESFVFDCCDLEFFCGLL